MTFRRIITRFGQLPLLFLVRLLVTVSAMQIANMIPWDQQLLVRLQTSDSSMIYGGIDRIAISLLSGFSLFCSYSLGSLIKRSYHKPRPNPQAHMTRRQKIDASSFPSIHTSNSLIMAVWGIIAIGWRDPDHTTTIVCAAIARILFYVLISYSRVILRKHFRIDILGGTIFGGLIVRAVMHRSSAILTLFHFPLHYLFS